jgi:hypothetical protein
VGERYELARPVLLFSHIADSVGQPGQLPKVVVFPLRGLDCEIGMADLALVSRLGRNFDLFLKSIRWYLLALIGLILSKCF